MVILIYSYLHLFKDYKYRDSSLIVKIIRIFTNITLILINRSISVENKANLTSDIHFTRSQAINCVSLKVSNISQSLVHSPVSCGRNPRNEVSCYSFYVRIKLPFSPSACCAWRECFLLSRYGLYVSRRS